MLYAGACTKRATVGKRFSFVEMISFGSSLVDRFRSAVEFLSQIFTVDCEAGTKSVSVSCKREVW